MAKSPLSKLTALAVLGLLGWTAFRGVRIVSFAFSPANPQNANPVVLDLRKGEGPSQISKTLATQGVIKGADDLVWLGRLTRQWGRIKVGEYEVSGKMTPMQILRVMTSGVSMAHPITLREGENMYELADEIEAKRLAPKERFLALCKDSNFLRSLNLGDPAPPTIEGYLYPDTYFFNRNTTPEEILRQMVKHFQASWQPDYDSRARELGLTRLQVVTLASIIEKETGAPEERPLISSVFHNRLKKRMKLQSDPTTIYGIWYRFEGKLHKSDLSSANKYNTYYIAALPGGPISNPGKDALRAALFPATSDYLFFVSHNDGTHEFTRNLRDHEKAVRKFQLDPNAREGKSWRDLSKRNAKPADAH